MAETAKHGVARLGETHPLVQDRAKSCSFGTQISPHLSGPLGLRGHTRPDGRRCILCDRAAAASESLDHGIGGCF